MPREFHIDCIDIWFVNLATCLLCHTSVEAPSRKPTICDACTPSFGEAMVERSHVGRGGIGWNGDDILGDMGLTSRYE